MASVLADQSKVELLKQQVMRRPFIGAQMGLFTFPLVLDHATTLAGILPYELAHPGYARQTLSGWTLPALTLDFHVQTFAGTVLFDNTSTSNSPTIYGWFFVDVIANRLICSGLYAPTITIPALSNYRTTPFFRLTGPR